MHDINRNIIFVLQQLFLFVQVGGMCRTKAWHKISCNVTHKRLS